MPASHSSTALVDILPELCDGQGAMRLHSGCKINLGLAITGRRADGYHLLDSVFLPLAEPHDVLIVSAPSGPGLTFSSTAAGIDPQKNTLTRAWQVFGEATDFWPALDLHLVKGVPYGAGLGGGSADAACLLRLLAQACERLGRPVADDALHAMATRVGADVPFFLHDGPMRVTGIGDVLEPVRLELPGRELLLVLPDIQVSTPWAYRAFDEWQEMQKGAGADRTAGRSPADAAKKALTGGGKTSKECLLLCLSVKALANDLEVVVFERYPELRGIREQLLRLGACAASMSGSGSAVFGLFGDRATACAAASSMEWPVQHVTLAGM